MSEPKLSEDELSRMSLIEHLEELRNRILWSLIPFFLLFLGSWTFSEQIYEFLARPYYDLPESKKLAFLSITGPFMVYVKVSALAAVFLSSPIILYQVWSFIAPGLYKKERRMAGPFIFFGSTLFLAGGAFAYYIAVPFAVKFLLGMGAAFEQTITIERYLSFLMTVILGLGVMFELPTLIFLLSRLGLVTPAFLLRHFRYAVLLIFIAAAILTPTPDIFNLCLFALPTIVLYLVGIGVAAVFGPRKREEEAAS